MTKQLTGKNRTVLKWRHGIDSGVQQNPACVPLTHFVPVAHCSSHHQVVPNVQVTVFAGALKEEMLLQLPLAVSRHTEEVHIANGQLLILWDFPQGSQLDPGREEDRTGPGSWI